MNPLFKAALAGGGGVFLSEYIEPHLVKLFKPESDFAKKAVKAGAGGVGAAGIFWLLTKA